MLNLCRPHYNRVCYLVKKSNRFEEPITKRLFALGVIILVTLFFTTMQLWAWTGSLASLTSRLGYAKIDA
jgi:hypothetical protein